MEPRLLREPLDVAALAALPIATESGPPAAFCASARCWSDERGSNADAVPSYAKRKWHKGRPSKLASKEASENGTHIKWLGCSKPEEE